MLKIISLGSGSKGNCLIISNGKESLAVDAGFSRRQLICRMKKAGITPESLLGVLITHEHGDHICGCRVLCNDLQIPAYMTNGTLSHLQKIGEEPEKKSTFLSGSSFHINDFLVETFPVSHDVIEPVGYVVNYSGYRIGIATDLGITTSVVEKSLRDCDALVIESNYDPVMLQNSNRTLEVKRRIASRVGHLRNSEARQLLEKIISERTKLVMFAHVSCECNSPCCIENEMKDFFAVPGRENIQWDILIQHDINTCRTLPL